MSKFYFTTTDDREYELSSTTSVSVQENAVVSKSPVESGKSIVDNYYLDNTVITFSGVITSVQVFGQSAKRKREVDTWIDEIRLLRKNKELVTVHYDDNQTVQNCVITRFNTDKTSKEGNSGWKCSLQFQEVTISERAKLTTVPEPHPKIKKDVDPNSKNSTSNKIQIGDELSTTVGSDAALGSWNYLTGGTN